MIWTICFVCAVAVLVASVLVTVCRVRINGRILDPTKVLFAGVGVALAVLSIPVFVSHGVSNGSSVIEMICLTIHNVILFFVIGADLESITQNIVGVAPWQYSAYSIVFSLLLVIAPVLTFGFVLSFFKNASAYQKYFLNYRDDAFVFSELNERSLTLASSLLKKHRLLVFTNVCETEDGANSEFIERAESLGAICFQNDIVSTNFLLHSKKSEIRFFVIGEDQAENVNLGLKLISKYGDRENTDLYIFSTKTETEFLLVNAYHSEKRQDNVNLKIKVRCINEVQSLVLRTLYDHGLEIFESATPREDGLKHISAVIVGLGQHGTQMLKALPWFCQMDGYSVSIDAFDLSETADLEFAQLCPELMSSEFNGNFDIDGEAKYKIAIHSGINVESYTFSKEILAMKGATYVFVALGTDDQNISVAIKLRGLFERIGQHPKIKAIVYDPDKKNALADIRNFKGQKYDIDFIGDLESSYSEAVILNSDVERDALQRHLKWGAEEDFWRFGYNYRSSVASAIHKKMKIACKIPGADKLPNERTEDELWAIRKMEHCRWNAYMRSEGYSYAPKRNDIAKLHHCLIPFHELPLSEQIKDDD